MVRGPSRRGSTMKKGRGRAKAVLSSPVSTTPEKPAKFQGRLSHRTPQVLRNHRSLDEYFMVNKNLMKQTENEEVAASVAIAAVRSSPRKQSPQAQHTPEPLQTPTTGNGVLTCNGSANGVNTLSITPHKIQLCEDNDHKSADITSNAGKARGAESAGAESGDDWLHPRTLSEKSENTCHKLTEYFPVRRSVRKTKKTVLEEEQRNLEDCVLSHKEEGLKVLNFEGKGRGVVTTRKFRRGEFVVEYCGELIDMTQARLREEDYSQDQNTGCYMYYFKYKNNQYCIDATAESGRLGRLVNHSRNGNLTTKITNVCGVPHLVLIAKDDIGPDQEVCYDYGDRTKESLKYHPWLAS